MHERAWREPGMGWTEVAATLADVRSEVDAVRPVTAAANDREMSLAVGVSCHFSVR